MILDPRFFTALGWSVGGDLFLLNGWGFVVVEGLTLTVVIGVSAVCHKSNFVPAEHWVGSCVFRSCQ